MIKVHYGFDNLPPIGNPAVTVGSFDGVHLGHKFLLSRLKQEASLCGGESVVVTFYPHPRNVIPGAGKVCELTTLLEKIALLNDLEIDHLIVQPFDEGFMMLSSDQFLERYISGKLRAARMVVGYNHRFGHDRNDHPDSLPATGIVRADAFHSRYGKISSTVIRELIASGDMELAASMLGHRYFMMGRNDGKGNVVPVSDSKLLPSPGFYPVKVLTGDISLDSVLRIPAVSSEGVLPTLAEVYPEGDVTVRF